MLTLCGVGVGFFIGVIVGIWLTSDEIPGKQGYAIQWQRSSGR